MSNAIKIQMTYQTVTHESAEHGDFADHGFAEPGGWRYSIADDAFQARCEADGRQKALKDMTPEPESFDSVEDAVDFLSGYGPFEPSSWPTVDAHTWLTQSDAIQDRSYFEDGEHTTLSFHVEAADPATVVEVLQGVLD